MRSTLGKLAFAALLSLAWLAPAQALAQGEMGSWKINPAKSKYNPGPPPREIVTKFEPAGKGIKNTTQMTNAQGTASTMVYTAQFDGKDYPLEGSAISNTVALKKRTDGSVERTDKKDGKVVFTMVRTLSKDGKTLTVVQKGMDGKGQPFENVMVFDRQ
jgi:hypothetical protein